VVVYGLGAVISDNWLLQDPLFSGESAVEAYLPSQEIGIAVAVTYASPRHSTEPPAAMTTSRTSCGGRSDPAGTDRSAADEVTGHIDGPRPRTSPGGCRIRRVRYGTSRDTGFDGGRQPSCRT
jgi:hypothetical protein